MIDREKVVTVLRRRFPDAHEQQIAGAANAIVGMGEEWEDVTGAQLEAQAGSDESGGTSHPVTQGRGGGEFRIFRRRV